MSSETFGGANVVLISLETTAGDIFNPATLTKIKKLTETVERIPGANNYQIFSIARQKVKDVRATSWGIEVQPVMWPDVPRTQEGIERLRNIVFANPTIVGRLVSGDGKAALISAAFHEERLDYAALFQRVQQAIKEAEDSNTRVFAVGEPILYGWIYYYLKTSPSSLATCLSILALLAVYYRNLNGVIIRASLSSRSSGEQDLRRCWVTALSRSSWSSPFSLRRAPSVIPSSFGKDSSRSSSATAARRKRPSSRRRA
jgi:predicted RND superfamily exporter protein